MRLVLTSLFLSSFAMATCEYSIPDEHCPGQKEVGDSIVCADVQDAFALLKSAKGKKLARLPEHVKFHDAIELNFLPDADSSPIYDFQNELKASNGKIVGYLSINGWVNEEMEVRLQVNTRYNRKGQLAVVHCR